MGYLMAASVISTGERVKSLQNRGLADVIEVNLDVT